EIKNNLQGRVRSRVRPVGLVNCAAIQARASERQTHRQVTRSVRPSLERVAESPTRRHRNEPWPVDEPRHAGVRPVESTLATQRLRYRAPSFRVSVRCGGYWTMQIGIDTWFLESLFARFKTAAHLVENIDDPIVADELTKSINEIKTRLA